MKNEKIEIFDTYFANITTDMQAGGIYMYRWYISINVNGTKKVVRSKADSFEDAKKEIEELYPDCKIIGYVEAKRLF